MNADWPEYNSATELKETANLVYIGKVTGVSFQVLDMKTALPATDNTAEWDRTLYTIYNVDVLTTYKGTAQRPAQIRITGGVQDKYVKEQLTALGKDAEKGIPLMAGAPKIAVGETYLFVLLQYKDTTPTLLNLEQCIYDLHNPFETYPNITAKDVISSFGNDKWNSFWTQWQKDNPNWETWINKSVVEKALAE